MKRILIIYPHWPPSNLVGVHRVRLIANELPELGWDTTVLTVDERDYEEELSPDTERLVSKRLQVVKVRARKPIHIFGQRLIGDIGLRGWFALRSKARELLKQGAYDFIWFSMPSWYPSLMGRGLHDAYTVPFGIDYQDPWIYDLPSDRVRFNRENATIWLARILEPLALRQVALVSGISEGYLSGVLNRHPELQSIPKATCQLGYSKSDHHIELPSFKLPFDSAKRTYVYAGAYWAQGQPLFEEFLLAVKQAKQAELLDPDVQFLFIGTGNAELTSLSQFADSLSLGNTFREISQRLSYLEVQQTLRFAEGAIVMGSTEPHYSASKIFQCLITAKRTAAYFHHESEGASILTSCNADSFYQPYLPDLDRASRIESLTETILKFTSLESSWEPDLLPLEKFSAKASAEKLVDAIQQISMRS